MARFATLLLLLLPACDLGAPEQTRGKDPRLVEDAKILRAQLEIRQLVAEVRQHRVLRAETPEDWSFRRKPAIDPWGEEYVLEYDGDRVVVFSSGADREIGTGDDVYVP